MRLKLKTVIYLVVAGIYTIIPAVIFGLLLGHQMPGYTVNSIDVMMVFCFSFVPFIVGFIGGEMFIDDMDDSDPLYQPDVVRKK